jgi:hypothetical protein
LAAIFIVSFSLPGASGSTAAVSVDSDLRPNDY